eukprot:TRINITY_DN11425_c0_g1_i1.p1 TRINITY_DN11425_c0_g1~~TRINITY_DN11425_c0_g1_i1.p1  ORF type:complete len:407 (-),score=71.33 TRINITY_DN11425_c0_g1_i1:17-1237(-)
MAWKPASPFCGGGPTADLDDQLKAWRQDIENRKASRGVPGDVPGARSVPALFKHELPLRSLDFDDEELAAAGNTSSSMNPALEGKDEYHSKLGVFAFGPPLLGGRASSAGSHVARQPMRLFEHSAPGSPERASALNGGLGSPSTALQEPQIQPQASPDRPRAAWLAGHSGLSLKAPAHPDELGTLDNATAQISELLVPVPMQEPLAREQGPRAPLASRSRDEAARKLAETRRALQEMEQELRDLDSTDGSQASDNELGQETVETMMVTPAAGEPPEVMRLRQELFAADEQIANLEVRLKQHTYGHWLLAGSDEAPSDASTAVSCGLPSTAARSEVQWNQRAQSLELELRSEAATAMEIQDRIHWLRSQLRKQPGLQDERVNSIRNLLADIADDVEAAAKGHAAFQR